MHVPNPGFIWQQLLQRERESKGGGGASLSPSPRSRAATSFGGKGWWPKQRSRQRGGAWHFCPPWMPRASKPASGVSAATAEWGGQDPPGLRNGLSGGGGREWSPLRCAALRRPAAPGARRGPPWGERWAALRPLQFLLVPSDWHCIAQERKGTIPQVLEAPSALVWGRLSSILLLRTRDQILLSLPRARRGPLPVARTGKFPPLPWHPALVAGGGLPRLPARGAQHPLGRGAERGPRGSPAPPGLPLAPPNRGPSHNQG